MTKIKDCQTTELTKTIRNLTVIEIIATEIEVLRVRKEEKAIDGRDVSVKANCN